jgi:hypothetical protein
VVRQRPFQVKRYLCQLDPAAASCPGRLPPQGQDGCGQGQGRLPETPRWIEATTAGGPVPGSPAAAVLPGRGPGSLSGPAGAAPGLPMRVELSCGSRLLVAGGLLAQAGFFTHHRAGHGPEGRE